VPAARLAYPEFVTAAQIDYVLFDLDDTLFDHRGAATAALGHAVGHWRPDASDDDLPELLALWQEIEQEEYDAYLGGACSHAEQRVRRLRRFLPALGVASGDDAYLATQFEHYLDVYVASWSAFADAPGSLDELEAAGIGMAVLTNGDPRQQRAKFERMGLLGRFDRILTPTEVGAPKPDAVAFSTACASLEIDAERTAYVGDNLEVDAVGAAAAGCWASGSTGRGGATRWCRAA
jgi:putative hydrolase of the HAD superfamily